MADFTALATRYVLADGEDEQRQLATQAAEGIRSAQRKSTAVLSWAQSINQWMPHSAGGASDGDGDGDGDVITRAKALGFLAMTLEVLDNDVLRVEQVEHLIAFFGAMFSIDHKAGILAAATALRCLCTMKYFRPSMAAAVLKHTVKLGDDFRLQAPATRRAIYELVALLLEDDAVRAALRRMYGADCAFLADLLPLCRLERDPDNLLRWFAVLQLVLTRYEGLAVSVAQEVFRTVSDYFPISMRSSATPAGTTVEDLKTALRRCFAASSLVAASVFDFLLQKLDQGDALTVSVKVDILSTMQACVEAFPHPRMSLVPHASRIWNSLKYEVRHGEVPETIDGTLAVIRAVSARLDGLDDNDDDDTNSLRDFVSLVLADCISDLANPTYTRQAGQLLISTLQGGLRSFSLAVAAVLTAVKEDLQKTQQQTVLHIRDLVAFLNAVLRTRQALLDEQTASTSTAAADFHSHDAAVLGLLDSVYLCLWNSREPASDLSQDPLVLREVTQGLAELVCQRGPADNQKSGGRGFLCSPEQCTKVLKTLAPHMQSPDRTQDASALASEAMLALRRIVAVFPDGFSYLLDQLDTAIRHEEEEEESSSADADILSDALSRMAFVGCSTLRPAGNDPLCHFRALTQALSAALERLLDSKAPFRLSSVVLSGIYLAMLNQRDAFAQKGVPAPAGKKRASAADDDDDAQALLPAFQDYVGEAMSIVRRLYLRATAAVEGGSLELSTDFGPSSSDGDDNDNAQNRYLSELANMTTFVVRDMDVDSQTAAKLHKAPFTLFHDDDGSITPAMFHSRQGGRVDVLSLGILRGLWPAVVANMADIPVSPLGLLEDWDTLDHLPYAIRAVRNSIATAVANKYSASTTGRPDNLAAWKATVAAVQAKLVPDNGNDGSHASPPLTLRQFQRLVAIAAGAFARLDRDARPLAPLLAAAPARHGNSSSSSSVSSIGEQMARSLRLLVRAGEDRGMDSLSAENHAVVKTVFKQWVYSQAVQPLLPLAFPRGGATTTTTQSHAGSSPIYAIAILDLVLDMPFSVYEDDVDDTLARILVAAATTLPAWPDVAGALCVLRTVLEHRPAAVQGHLRTLVDASIGVFGSGRAWAQTATKTPTRAQSATPPCRKQALKLVAALPAHFEEGLLLPYEPRLVRALTAACGDPVREIREVAQHARENWRKVV